MKKERRELHCGLLDECEQWIDEQPKGKKERMEVVTNPGPGPECFVYYKRRPRREPVITKTLRRMTREKFRVNGVTKDHNRPLWVSFKPGDVIEFCPIGTSQRVAVPIAKLYGIAKLHVAQAAANAKRAKKGARK